MSAQQPKLRWGILGTAHISKKVAKAMHAAPNCELVAIGSRDLAKARAWAAENGAPVALGSYLEVIEHPEVDAVYIPLPSTLKKPWAMQAIAKGKHIMVDKPFAGTVQDVEDMITACAKAGLQFMDATMWPHAHRTRDIQQHLERGDLGAIRRVNANLTFLAPDEKWTNGGNIRTNGQLEEEGCFGDMGWYPVGAILFGMGWELPTKVQMYWAVYNKLDTILSSAGTLWFSNDKIGSFDIGCQACFRQAFEIVGEKATIRVLDQVGGQGRNGVQDEVLYDEYEGSVEYVIGDVFGKDQTVRAVPSDMTCLMMTEFADCVFTKRNAKLWPERSLKMHKVMYALFMSSQRGGRVVEFKDGYPVLQQSGHEQSPQAADGYLVLQQSEQAAASGMLAPGWGWAVLYAGLGAAATALAIFSSKHLRRARV